MSDNYRTFYHSSNYSFNLEKFFSFPYPTRERVGTISYLLRNSRETSIQIYASFNVSKIIFTQYGGSNNKRGTIYYDTVKGNSFTWVDFYCRGNVAVEFFDKNGKTVDFFTRGKALSYLDDSNCNYKHLLPSQL